MKRETLFDFFNLYLEVEGMQPNCQLPFFFLHPSRFFWYYQYGHCKVITALFVQSLTSFPNDSDSWLHIVFDSESLFSIQMKISFFCSPAETTKYILAPQLDCIIVFQSQFYQYPFFHILIHVLVLSLILILLNHPYQIYSKYHASSISQLKFDQTFTVLSLILISSLICPY